MGKAGEKAAKTPNRLLPDFMHLGAALQRGWPVGCQRAWKA